MANLQDKLKAQWKGMKPQARMGAAFGGIVVVAIVVGIMLAPKTPVVEHKAPTTSVDLGLPGAGHDLSIEKLSASMAALQSGQDKLQAQVAGTTAAVNETQQKIPSAVSSNPDVEALKAEVKALKTQLDKQSTLDGALPSADQSAPVPSSPEDMPRHRSRGTKVSSDMPVLPDAGDELPAESAQAQSKPAETQPKFVTSDDGYKPQAAEEKEKEKEPKVFLPAGSNFEVSLLNGMDAPTSGVAQKNPVPAIMRVRTDAILPNRYKYDVKECFVVVSGYGELASERANMQTTALSCVKNNGAVIEARIEGYVVGEDGKVGMRGRVVTKQGALLAKSFAAGFLSGIANVMSPLAVPQLNTMPGSTVQYQNPNLSALGTAGVAQGVTQSGQMLAQFYLQMAKEMFPVVEIDAGRKATIMLLKGVELNFTEKKS